MVRKGCSNQEMFGNHRANCFSFLYLQISNHIHFEDVSVALVICFVIIRFADGTLPIVAMGFDNGGPANHLHSIYFGHDRFSIALIHTTRLVLRIWPVPFVHMCQIPPLKLQSVLSCPLPFEKSKRFCLTLINFFNPFLTVTLSVEDITFNLPLFWGFFPRCFCF